MLNHFYQVFVAFIAALAGYGAYRSARPVAPAAAPESPAPPQAPAAPAMAPDGLTARGAAELVGHEAIVREAYRDSRRIWTWGIGVTDASGHSVERYIDSPQTVEHCLDIFIWLLRAKYLPAVIRAFRDHPLSEAQLAAALSFHYNTGAIGYANWVALWKGGQAAAARAAFMTWDHPSSIVERRRKECALFFDGIWSGDGKASVIPVLKPSYQPDFRHAERIDILPALQGLLEARQ